MSSFRIPSIDPLNWKNPNEFDPESYKQAAMSEQNNEAKVEQVRLAQSPFNKEDFQANDGRHFASPVKLRLVNGMSADTEICYSSISRD